MNTASEHLFISSITKGPVWREDIWLRLFPHKMWMCTCWHLVCAHCPLAIVCVSKHVQKCDALSTTIHTLVSLVTTGHHLNHFFIKGHPRPLLREFPPSPFLCCTHQRTWEGVCKHAQLLTHSFTPLAYENLDQNDVDSGCEWMSVRRRRAGNAWDDRIGYAHVLKGKMGYFSQRIIH